MVYVLAQGSGYTDEIELLLNSSPFRVLFMLVVVSQFLVLLMAWQVTRQANRNIAAQNDQQTAVIKNNVELTRIIDDLRKHLADSQDRNEDNYLVISTNAERYMGDIEAIKAAVQSIKQPIITATAEVIIEATNLHARTRALITEEIESLLQNVSGQRAVELFAAGFRFPEPNDCRWRVAVISPSKKNFLVAVCRLPVWRYDDNIIGRLRESGEVVTIITDTAFPGWYAVKQQFGEVPLSGWVESRKCTINILASSLDEQAKESENEKPPV